MNGSIVRRNVLVVFIFVLALALPGCTVAAIAALQQGSKSERAAVAEDQRLADLGHSALSGGSYKLAEAYLTEALDANPDNLFALHDLGIVYYSTNRSEQARALQAKLVSLDPAAGDLGRANGIRRHRSELFRR